MEPTLVTGGAAVKRTGRVFGRISFDPDRVIDWGIHTEGFTVADIDQVAQLDVPMRGKLVIESSGRGKEGAINIILMKAGIVHQPAGDAGQAEHRQAGQQHALAAEPVRQAARYQD